MCVCVCSNHRPGAAVVLEAVVAFVVAEAVEAAVFAEAVQAPEQGTMLA